LPAKASIRGRQGRRWRECGCGVLIVAALLVAVTPLAAWGQGINQDLDPIIQQRVAKRLDWDKGLAAFDIHVRVHDGLVRLAGTVATLDERRRALRIADQTKDVIGVVNGLKVGTGVGSRTARHPVQPTDAVLRHRVLQALAQQRDLDADGISVAVSRGEVTLSGQVPLRRQRHLAKRTAESLFGVRGVRDNLTVAAR
jgi:osmotically-inducible protein OsmY